MNQKVKKKNRKLLLAAVLVAAWVEVQAHAKLDQMFGYPGQNGGDGVSGFSGQSYGRQAITVPAGSGPVGYNFSGGPGGDGGNGANGTQAGNCFGQYNVDFDLIGAPGGSGGNAGLGGNGGNGADVTVTYTPSTAGNPLSDLRNVSLYLAGGQAGRSGAPGRGLWGCRCQVRHWQFTRHVPVTQHVCEPPHPTPIPSPAPSPAPSPLPPVCHDEIVYVDQLVDHYCNDGQYGRDGTVSQASYGAPGTVTLIPSNKPTHPDFPAASFAVGQMPWAATLTEDAWAVGTGAQLLFAPGSILADAYRYYAGRTYSPVKAVWNAKRSNSDVSAVTFQVNLQNGILSSSHDSSQLWAAVSKRVDSAGTVFSVDAAANPAEALKVTAAITGTNANTAIVLTDDSGISDLVQTSAYAKLESKGIFWWTRFDDNVPQGQIEVLSPTQILIHVGQFWPHGNMGDLKPGKEVRFTITINRKLGDDSGSEPAIKLQQKL